MKMEVIVFFGTRAITLVMVAAAASILGLVYSFPVWAFPLQQVVGIAVIFATKKSDYDSNTAFSSAGGTFYYTNSPRSLVEYGPYARARNPLYLSLFTDTFALFLISGSLAYLLVLALLVAIVDWVVVRREEPGLTKKFGEDYRKYKEVVPRWIPRVRKRPSP